MHEYNFPFEPYDIQLEFMQQLRSVLQHGQIGIFASPTGTGKSMSLLCGTLSWLRDNSRDSSLDTVSDSFIGGSTSDLDDEPEWVREFALNAAGQKRKRISDDESSEIEAGATSLAKFSRRRPPMKVIYASRTHSQLSQFVSEMRKTSFARDFGMRSIALGSRKQLCINCDVKRLKSVKIMNDRCQGLREHRQCKYYEASRSEDKKTEFLSRVFKDVSDIEDVVRAGEDTGCCPYYAVRDGIPFAELTVVPYSILLGKDTRDSAGLDVRNSIVIIDEAHNLIDAIAQLYSSNLKDDDLVGCVQCLKTYLERYSEKLSGDHVVSLKQLLVIVRKMQQFVEKVAVAKEMKEVYSVHEFVRLLRIENMNLFGLIAFLRNNQIARKTQKYHDIQVSEDAISEMSPVYLLISFLENLALEDNDGRVIVEQEDSTVCVKYLLLNVGEPFKDIVDSAYSVILAGGTMEPVQEVYSQLLPHVPTEKVVYFSCKHIVPAAHVSLITLPSGPSGLPLEYNYQSRLNSSLMKETGDAILKIARLVPAGMVVFFPSFAYLKKSIDGWSSSILGTLQSIKKPFIEPTDARNVEKTLQEYESAIKEPENGGAIIFCVIGGKLSEGINFSDDLARAVCVIGLPFPNRQSLELNVKMSHLDELAAAKLQARDNEDCAVTGHEYYENLCMKAVNQSIGRAIRHRGDFAAIILLDKRYAKAKIQRKLPDWMKESLVDLTCRKQPFNDLLLHLSKFYSSVNYSP